MVPPRLNGVPVVFVLLLASLSLSFCGDDSNPSGPGPEIPLVYGALVTPRVSMQVDPLLADGYQNLGADHFTVGHLAISWAGVERGQLVRDWRALDRQVERARQRGMKLSVVLEFLHGGVVEVPAWRWPEFPGWNDPELEWALVGFLREMEVRSQGTIGYLWLGEGADRYAAESLDDDRPLISFLSMLGDSARAIFPGSRIGSLVNPAMLAETGGEPLAHALQDSLDLLGLWVYPDIAPGGDIDPQAAMTQIQEWIAPWSNAPVAIVEIGYPSSSTWGSSEAEQAEFASLLAEWLRNRPRELEFCCVAPLHDADAELADSLARRRYPGDPDGESSFASMLASYALRRNDGSPKPGRQRFYEERP